jgi:hypothetical protein
MEKTARVRPRDLAPIKVTIIESDQRSWLRIGLFLGFTALFTTIALLMLPDRSAVLAPGILSVTLTDPGTVRNVQVTLAQSSPSSETVTISLVSTSSLPATLMLRDTTQLKTSAGTTASLTSAVRWAGAKMGSTSRLCFPT